MFIGVSSSKRFHYLIKIKEERLYIFLRAFSHEFITLLQRLKFDKEICNRIFCNYF